MELEKIFFGPYSLEFIPQQNQTFSARIMKDDVCLYRLDQPIVIMLKDYAAKAVELTGAYSSVTMNEKAVIALGKIRTKEGNIFRIQDRYYPIPESALRIEREITVEEAKGSDLGFASRFSVGMAGSQHMEDYDYFAPGAWYQQNQYVPNHFMGKNQSLNYYWYRETRFALPFFSMQNRMNGETVSISRAEADLKLSELYEKTYDSYTDRSFDYGSLGISVPQQLSLDYVYPGTEGFNEEWTPYYNSPYQYQFGFNRRYHPVTVGFTQSYQIILHCSSSVGFYSMMKREWRYFYQHFDPPIKHVNNRKLYHTTMKLFDSLCQEYYGVYGLPFKCLLPSGEIGIVDYQFGFIGQQPNIAYLMLKYGLQNQKLELAKKAEKILDFWSENSLTEWGAPKTWYGVSPQTFLDQPIWLRMIGDGMEGVLNAYCYMRDRGNEKTSWFLFCRHVADWLVTSAGEDGTWRRAYRADGSIYLESKANTSNVIRFLVRFFEETKDRKYYRAAIRAGEWCYQNIYQKMCYVGGTCDNADVLDKESGIYAMFAFLALYELTQEKRWLEALTGAADYTETWTYAWSYPVRPIEAKHALHHVDISGQSLIATGHSAADVYMAGCSYLYLKIYQITHDEHYLQFARFIHNNPKQATELDGKFGYGRLGLCEESAEFAFFDTRGVYAWLPWCSYVQIEPIDQLLNQFGVYEIEDIPEELLK